MRVCLVSYEFPPRVGGEGSYTYTLMRTLKQKGLDVTVLTDARNGLVHSMEEVRYLHTSSLPGLRLYSFCAGIESELKRLGGQLDVVHYTNDYCGFSLPKKLGKPLVATVHHPYLLENEAFKREVKSITAKLSYTASRRIFLVDKLQKRLCKSSDIIIAVSRAAAEYATSRLGVYPGKVRVVPNGVDIEKYNPNVRDNLITARLGLGSGPMVLYLGRLDHYKGLNYLLRAFSELVKEISDAQLLIVGRGPIKRELLSETERMGLEKYVRITDPVEEETKPMLYAAASVVVNPSIMEGAGLTLLEAMASGKPSIAARSGGMPEMVSDGESGIIVPPTDHIALHRALLNLLTDRSMSVRMGATARKRAVEEFSYDLMASRTVAVYEEVCSEKVG